MNSGTMLNAYPDSMGGDLSALIRVLEKPELQGAFRSFYLLPSVFHTDLDRGFSVISYDLNRRLVAWDDLEQLRTMRIDLKLDFILNHLSVLSPQFQDILEKGDQSPYRDFFIDWNRFWRGHGKMTEGGILQPDENCLREIPGRKGSPVLEYLLSGSALRCAGRAGSDEGAAPAVRNGGTADRKNLGRAEAGEKTFRNGFLRCVY